jgi:hypothetical protein
MFSERWYVAGGGDGVEVWITMGSRKNEHPSDGGVQEAQITMGIVYVKMSRRYRC